MKFISLMIDSKYLQSRLVSLWVIDLIEKGIISQSASCSWGTTVCLTLQSLRSPVREAIQRLRSPVREAFSYGILTSLWFNEVWPYALLNHKGICRPRMKVSHIRDYTISVLSVVGYFTQHNAFCEQFRRQFSYFMVNRLPHNLNSYNFLIGLTLV